MLEFHFKISRNFDFYYFRYFKFVRIIYIDFFGTVEVIFIGIILIHQILRLPIYTNFSFFSLEFFALLFESDHPKAFLFYILNHQTIIEVD